MSEPVKPIEQATGPLDIPTLNLMPETRSFSNQTFELVSPDVAKGALEGLRLLLNSHIGYGPPTGERDSMTAWLSWYETNKVILVGLSSSSTRPAVA